MDHWLGGSGRRRQEERPASVWALCRTCNQKRTENVPNAAYWNRQFQEHCLLHGYEFIPHVLNE
jgi:hypothetical protein